MDAVLLARLQFAMTIGFHYLFPPLTIGLAWLIVWILARHLRTGDPVYRQMARFWIRVFAVSFAIGVATGITMEFQFGTNWAEYSRFVGDIFGAPLAAEGIFTFFLESTFLGVLLWGEHKVSPRLYAFSALMVAVGSTSSAFWIIAANSWQQTPAGFALVGGRAELTDFWAAVFNPSTVPRFLHAVDAALITGAFFMAGLSAWFLLRREHVEFARRSLAIGLVVAAAATWVQWPLGHYHAVQVAQTQPAKLAAFEGLWETQSAAPLLVFGLPDVDAERTRFALELPGALSIGVGGSSDTVVQGLTDFPREDRPPILLSFLSFHGMVGLGCWFSWITAFGLVLLWRRRAHTYRPFLWGLLLTVPLPFLGNELGWIAAEVGRQPWIVQGLLRTSDAASEVVSAGQIVASIVMFGVLYTLLFFLWIFLLRRKLRHGPPSLEEVTV